MSSSASTDWESGRCTLSLAKGFWVAESGFEIGVGGGRKNFFKQTLEEAWLWNG